MEARTPPAPGRRPDQPRVRRGKPGGLIFFIVFAVIGLLIAKQEIPQVDAWYQQLLHPARWQATQQCQQAALQAATAPDFARIIHPGTVHETAGGLYVEDVVVGEKGSTGTELRFHYSCYTDTDGSLLEGARKPDSQSFNGKILPLLTFIN